MTYRWKTLSEGYNFVSNLIAIGGLHAKLCALKVVGVLVVGISTLPLGNPETKSHLDVAPMERHIVYYKGEGGDFPPVRVVVSLVCPSCPWFVQASKVLQPCTIHFVLVLCRFVWVIEACQFFLVPSQSSSTPLYPSIMLRARERGSTPYSFVVFRLGFTFESLKELGVHHFTFCFKANVLMICIFFTLFHTCHFPLKFILTLTWATINTCWLRNSMDVALGNYNDIF